MRTVGIRELKDHLSEYVRLARSGEGFLVTAHGEVVAELRPPEHLRSVTGADALRELVRRGTAHAVVRNDPSLYRTYERAPPRTSAKALLDWDRDER